MSHTPPKANTRPGRSTAPAASLRTLCVALFAACLPASLPAADLTLQDGVVVKFGQDAQLVVRDGLSTGDGVTLTSQKDDSTGGQAQPAAQVPAAGDWLGLRIEKSAAASGTTGLKGLAIRYAGGDDATGAPTAAFALRGASPALQYLQVTDSAGVGLRLSGASPSIVDSSFLRNGTGLDAADGSRPTISRTQFVGNDAQAILNRAPATVIPATGNWWGHATGPRDPVGNPGGQGDAVSPGVDYGNYLSAVPLLNPTLRLVAPAPYFETSSVALQVSCVNATEYRIAEGSAFSGVAFQPLSNGSATIDFALSAGDGRKSLAVQFRDPSGTMVTASLDGGVLVDTQAPTVALTNPTSGSLVREPITIEADASDVSGVQQVEFFLGTTRLATRTAAPYTYAWNTDAVGDGNYIIKAVATDQAGRSAEHSVAITVSHGAPVPDTEGPSLTNIVANGVVLADGAVFTGSTRLDFDASDRSGISRIELLLDGVVAATATGSTRYSATLDVDGVANGAHALALRALDSLGNASTISYAITVAHAPPAAPAFTQPANGLVTRNASLAVSGTAEPGSSAQLLLGGQPAGAAISVGGDGRFAGTVTLQPGLNQLQASATDAHGTSPLSTPVEVTLDASVPGAPGNLAAAVATGGRIRLTWTPSSDPNATATEIYRATSEFATIAEAQQVARVSASTSSHEDAPVNDGQFFYRVATVNAAGTYSAPSNLASAAIDRTAPFAERIEYAGQGAFDPATATFGQGRLDIKVTISEPLLGTPYLSLVPEGGLPIPVDLIKRDDLHYEGAVTLAADAGTGLVNTLFSARDVTNNRGTEVREGATLRIDTQGPEVTAISLDPQAPVKVDASRTVTATLGYDEPLAATPTVQYLLSGTGRVPVAVASVVQVDPLTWRATFELPADAGQAAPEQLSLGHVAGDALGNTSSRISAGNAFQVYQGELPALNVPLGLKATAQPGGQVQLEWQAVDGADGYQVYRQAPADAELSALARSAGTTSIDNTPVDGLYRYAVASVRTFNGQETISGQSPVIEVRSSRVAPGAPQNLTLELTPQGVLARWQPPVGTAPASYRLYRAAQDVITSVEGLAPLKQGIKVLQAMDAVPSQSEHAYVVTAIDAAGNESALSNSAYLNFSLLPVKQLQVEQVGEALPVLGWTPNGSGAVGYDVFVGADAERIKLTATPTTATTLTDTGFTGGARRYTVEAIDANDVRMPRSIVLPNATLQVASGLPLKRNVMNRLNVQVSNLSAEALNAARVEVDVAGRKFRSEQFALGGNATRLVPVVIGGHPDIPNPAMLTLVLENAASEGELARLGWQKPVEVIDSALVVGLEAENFTRGATGNVRLTVENTSEVEVELLTARNFGRTASSELRLKLLDADGNLLGSTPYLQATGAGVITLADGQTVARIAPGQRYVSDVFQMPVPASAPDQVRLVLEVDRLRYATGQPEEVAIPGIGSERNVALVETPYYGEVASVDPAVSYGTSDIVIAGRAVDRATGTSVPNAPLKLAFNQEGFERLANVTTHADGSFRHVFKPTLTDSGQYRVGAIHPDMTDRPEQGRFTINRVNVSPSSYRMTVPRNYAYRIDFRASTGTGSQLDNLRIAYLPEHQPSGTLATGITVDAGAPVDIAPRQNLALPVRISGDNNAAPSGRVVLAVLSDGSGATPLALLNVDYTLTEATPALFPTPEFIETGLAQGQSLIEQVVLENKGFIDAADVAVQLLDKDGNAAPGWIAIASNPAIGVIAIGAKKAVDLNIAPPAGTPEGVYEFKLRFSGSNVPEADIGVFVSVTQSGQGSVLFRASDIYTATTDKDGNIIPGLKGARIYLQNEAVVSQTYELLTDTLGEAMFQNIPAGTYRFKASAQNHQETTGRISVRPGVVANQSVFLEYTLISVEWSVREVTIEDRYEITLNATFETDVPAPVVVLQPTSINLPEMSAGEVFQGELVLTNYGLLRADDLQTVFPKSDDFFKFEFLAQPPTSLEAKQRVRLPYRVVALRDYGASAGQPSPAGGSTSLVAGGSSPVPATQGASLSPIAAAMATTASGSSGNVGCFTYSNQMRETCKYTCANGQESTNCGSATNWFYVESWGCPVGGTPIPGGSGGIGGGGWGGGGSGPGYGGMPGLPLCTKGQGDCDNPGQESAGGNEGGE